MKKKMKLKFIIIKKKRKKTTKHTGEKKGRVGRERAIPAIKDKLMNWSYAVQPGD